MIILPAIDIINGKVVRLCEGKYETSKNYGLSPLEAAASFYECGARHLHVVDLDGAKSGRAENASVIESICSKFDFDVEVGGGIRTFGQIEKYLCAGVSRVILGTVAVKNYDFVEEAVKRYGDKIAVGIDCKDEFIAINGWKEVTDIHYMEFCNRLQVSGVENIIFTDISRDGMLKGTNLDIYKVLCQTLCVKITASGGISDVDELIKLKEIGVYGAILGKALYENVIDLREAIERSES